jgi:hypothetical protein
VKRTIQPNTANWHDKQIGLGIRRKTDIIRPPAIKDIAITVTQRITKLEHQHLHSHWQLSRN